MEQRVNTRLVGGFAALMLAGLVAFLLWAAKHQSGREFSPYHVYFDQAVNGLATGSAVRFMGVEVGQVDGIELAEYQGKLRVQAEVSIDTQVPVNQSTLASLKPSGITGMYFIDLRNDPATQPQPLPKPEDGLPVMRSEQSDIDRLFGGAGNTMQRAEMVLARLETLLSDDNLASITTTLKSVEKVSSSLAGEDMDFANVLLEFAGAAKEMKSMLRGLNEDGFQEDLSALVEDAQSTVDRLDRLAESLERDPSQILFPTRKDGVEIAP